MITRFNKFKHFIKFSWNLWNIVSRWVKENSKFPTFPGKMEILAQPIDQSSWIKFRGPVLNQQSSLQNFRFPTLSTCSEQTCHKIYLGTHFGVTRKDPDPEKIPRASFDLINLCAKFHSHILTESASNRRVTRPLKCQICPPLLYGHIYHDIKCIPSIEVALHKVGWNCTELKV